MNRELQDYVWSVLPKEFKDEVKYEYYKTKTKKIKKECDLGFLNAHEGMFGVHNLTSDAEGEGSEELLTARRKVIQEAYAANERIKKEYPRGIIYKQSDAVNGLLWGLFGSKCLPDNVDSLDSNVDSSEPKPAEPKEDKHFDNILKGGTDSCSSLRKLSSCKRL